MNYSYYLSYHFFFKMIPPPMNFLICFRPSSYSIFLTSLIFYQFLQKKTITTIIMTSNLHSLPPPLYLNNLLTLFSFSVVAQPLTLSYFCPSSLNWQYSYLIYLNKHHLNHQRNQNLIESYLQLYYLLNLFFFICTSLIQQSSEPFHLYSSHLEIFHSL